jgi:hypothetical protein
MHGADVQLVDVPDGRHAAARPLRLALPQVELVSAPRLFFGQNEVLCLSSSITTTLSSRGWRQRQVTWPQDSPYRRPVTRPMGGRLLHGTERDKQRSVKEARPCISVRPHRPLVIV